jgi:predicted enzyme related to lactoylglutathione lyase
MDSVTHFEIPVDNPKRASEFYTKVFGWQVSQWPGMGYWMVGTTASDQEGRATTPGAINGGLGKRDGPLKAPTVTIKVADLDKTIDWVKQSGGKVAREKAPVGDMGFTAYIHDSEGNTIGLWQDAAK